MNLASIIEPHDAASVALISRGHVTTYGELRDDVAGLRGGLVGLGIEAGDRVGILCANNWYFVSSYLAILGIGENAARARAGLPLPGLRVVRPTRSP